MSTRTRAENAAVITQTATAVTAMRITAVRACKVYFGIDCFGVDPTDNKVIGRVYRGRSNGTVGSPIVPVPMDSTDADDVDDLATFLDVFSDVSSLGVKVDQISVHPQSNRFTLAHKLAPGETLDLETDMYASDSVPIQCHAVVRDLE